MTHPKEVVDKWKECNIISQRKTYVLLLQSTFQ